MGAEPKVVVVDDDDDDVCYFFDNILECVSTQL